MTTDFRYEPTWDSLQTYGAPQWFMDDKLGIFIHWGVYSVPAFDAEHHDGFIPAEATQLLLDLGGWLDVNGEAIYGTRHWERFGEGDTAVEDGHMSERKNQPFPAKDVRFTRKGDSHYAIVMGWPGNGAAISSLGSGSSVGGGRIRGVSMLGSDEPIDWNQEENALIVSAPRQRPWIMPIHSRSSCRRSNAQSSN